MVTTGTARRYQMLGQLGLSVTATVVATLILSGARYEVGWFRGEQAPTRPDLTSGGKFAARVEALRASPDEPAIAPPRVPILVADAALRSVPILLSERTYPALGVHSDTAKVARRVARIELRHRTGADAAVDVLPPKRSANVMTASASPGAPEALEVTAANGPAAIWSHTKGLYTQAVSLGGAALDRLNPLNLIP